MTAQVPVIAVDGPSGTGKGTICEWLARTLGWHLLDSGVLYRAVGWLAGRRGIAFDDAAALGTLAETLPITFHAGAGGIEVALDGVTVTAELRMEEAGMAASRVAVLPAVRGALLARQRALRRPPGLIADGRDMGTVVFPDAVLKIFLTASPEARAERRYKQLKGKGIDGSLAALLEDIRIRDERDAQRSLAPLKPALDAVILDTTQLGIDEVEARVSTLLHAHGLLGA